MNKISIATNVTSRDATRILNVLPNWLKIFGSNIQEILIVYDKQPTEGRIKELHKTSSKIKSIEFYFDEIMDLDSRIRITNLYYDNTNDILIKWFHKKDNPIRCQAGTPIYAFIYAIDKAKSEFVFKVDCDMVFYDNGFVDKLIDKKFINNYDFIEVSKTGSINISESNFSTRAFLINKKVFYQKLPIKAHKLDLIRQLHRKITRRSVYLALEQMLQIEIEKLRFKKFTLPPELGYSMHIATLTEMNLSAIGKVIEKFGNGIIPKSQILDSENFCCDYWEEVK